MSLSDWARAQWLTELEGNQEEIGNLLGVADRDLKDCEITGLSNDARLAIAYNGALQSATAALRAAGYRLAREAHHYRTILSLEHTIGWDKKLIAKFEAFRKKRNLGDYTIAGSTSKKEADEMVALAQQLRKQVEDWIRENHPELHPDSPLD
jgi:hypothetical protein